MEGERNCVSSGNWAALTLICEHSRYPLRMETQCFFPSFLAVMLRAGPHTCQAMLFHSAAAQLYHFVRIKKPNATLLNPPKPACLGVQENGSATFIDTLVRGGEQRSELLHSLPSPGSLLSFLPTTAGSEDSQAEGEAQHLHWPGSWPPV